MNTSSETINHHLSDNASDEFSYKLLKGHYRTDGSYKTDEQLRMEYIQLTDRLIYEITKGGAVVDKATGVETVRPYDTVIFLD